MSYCVLFKGIPSTIGLQYTILQIIPYDIFHIVRSKTLRQIQTDTNKN